MSRFVRIKRVVVLKKMAKFIELKNIDMKKITMLAGVLLLGLQLTAQTKFESTGDYARLYDITYDTTVQGKLYALSLSNHLVTSLDDGVTWDVLYSYPIEMSNLQWLPGHTMLSFTTAEGLVIYNPATNAVIASMPVPPSNIQDAGPSYIQSYDIYDAAATTIVLNTGFSVGFSNYGKTFYSNNAGATWKEIYFTFDHDNVFVNDVAIAPNNPQKIFLTRGHGDTEVDGGLFVSTDAGTTFTELLNGVILDPITFRPSNPNEILIGTGIAFGQTPEALYKSTDGGATWTKATIKWNDVTLNNIIKIEYNPKNENEVILLEENEIVTTTDGGTTWQNEVYSDTAKDYVYGLSASFNPFSQKIVIGTDYFPQYTLDHGKTLTQIKAPFTPTINVSVAQTSAGTDLYYGSQGGYFHKNIATGLTEGHGILGPDVFTANYKYAVADPAVPGRVFIIVGGGFNGSSFTVSTDYGATLTPITSTFSTIIDGITTVPGNNNIVYVSTRLNDSGTLYKVNFTNPQAITFEEIILPGDTGVVTGVIATDANNVTIAKLTSFYKSTDGDLTWTELTTKGLTINPERDIIWDVVQSPVTPGNWLAATNVGIFKSEDNGANWALSLPDVNVRKISYSSLNANDAVAAVYTGEFIDAALMATTNNGENWNTVGIERLNRVATGSVDFAFEGRTATAYLSTSDLGVMSYVMYLDNLSTNNPAAAKNTISVYPNPAVNVITVASAANSVNVIGTAIYSLTGQKVLETTKTTIDISSLSKGVYVVKATTTSGTFSQKLIKQ